MKFAFHGWVTAELLVRRSNRTGNYNDRNLVVWINDWMQAGDAATFIGTEIVQRTDSVSQGTVLRKLSIDILPGHLRLLDEPGFAEAETAIEQLYPDCQVASRILAGLVKQPIPAVDVKATVARAAIDALRAALYAGDEDEISQNAFDKPPNYRGS